MSDYIDREMLMEALRARTLPVVVDDYDEIDFDTKRKIQKILDVYREIVMSMPQIPITPSIPQPLSEGMRDFCIMMTQKERKALAEYIEETLLDTIRADREIDNLGWVRTILSAQKALRGPEEGEET